MGILQLYQFWVGCFFALLLIVFFMIAFFRSAITAGQWQILRLLGCFCAGFAAGIITGVALFEARGNLRGLDIAISGSAGFAAMFSVWLTWGSFTSPPAPPAFNLSIPGGWTFEDAARAIADQDQAVIQFVNFGPHEMRAPLREQELHAKSAVEALKVLHLVVVNGGVRSYKVENQHPIYRLVI
jgi:hypothetical protein